MPVVPSDNNSNGDFYSASSAGRSEENLFPNHPSSVDPSDRQAHEIPGDRSDIVPEQISIPSTTTAIETPIEVPVLNGVPSNRCGGNQNVRASTGYSSSAIRTGYDSTWRFQPYGTSRAQGTEDRNAEADPSSLTPLQLSLVGLPTPSPTEEIVTLTIADADDNQGENQGETEGAPGREKTRRRYGKGKPRKSRKLAQVHALELRDIVKTWKGLPKRPPFNTALSHVLDYIPTVREVVYELPRLASGATEPLSESSGRAMKERNRRDEERSLYEGLSRFYDLEEHDRDQLVWERPSLLREVLEDLKVRYPPLAPESAL